MAHPTQRPTVAILYGAGEGRLSSAKLRAALRQAGFSITTESHRADVLIAHSGGMFYLPAVRSGKVAVVVFRDDPWSEHLPQHNFHSRLPYSFMHYDRLHDDIWINPKDYVTVLQYLYAT